MPASRRPRALSPSRSARPSRPGIPARSATPLHAVAGPTAAGLLLGYLADRRLGDPRRGHPVAGFGRAAGALEHLLWRDHRTAGAVFTALAVAGTAVPAALAERRLGPVGRAAATAAVAWAVLGGTSLGREALRVGAALEAGDLTRARELLPRLCGRDPNALDADGIARAVVESVAENTSDAVVGALVWGAVAGVPGLVGFRAVNTLDAMVGHRSPRYARFGWASARLDDLVGLPGARLTALLATVVGPDPGGALRARRADGGRHPSPNAGPVEAAFAGALGLRLGGTLSYGGRVEHRPVLNAAGRAPGAGDIARTVRLSRRVGAAALAVAALGALAKGAGRAGGAGRTRPTRPTGPTRGPGHGS